MPTPALAAALLAIPATNPTVHARTTTHTTPISITIDGAPLTLDLRPFSLRDQEFTLRLDFGPDGQLAVTAPPPTTVRGSIAGEPGSIVAGSWDEHGATLYIRRADGEVYTLQPAAQPRPDGTIPHTITPEADLPPNPGLCGVTDSPDTTTPAPADATGRIGAIALRPRPAAPDPSNRLGSNVIRRTEIALEADYPYFSAQRLSESRTLADAETVLAAVAVIYERDARITYTLTDLLIRATEEADPLATMVREAVERVTEGDGAN